VPGPSLLQAQEDQRAEAVDPAANCRLVEVALDEGYGVSRRVVRTDCSTVQ
jgi:DNA-binding GntR family transcriptional regulator